MGIMQKVQPASAIQSQQRLNAMALLTGSDGVAPLAVNICDGHSNDPEGVQVAFGGAS